MMTIAKIKRASLDAGSHFFEPATMRFFASRVAEPVWYGADGSYYFVTSERFIPFRGEPHARRYTVRKWSETEPRSVETVGEFQAYATARAAYRAAAAVAADSSAVGVQS